MEGLDIFSGTCHGGLSFCIHVEFHKVVVLHCGIVFYSYCMLSCNLHFCYAFENQFRCSWTDVLFECVTDCVTCPLFA